MSGLQQNAGRIKNILAGDYTSNSKIQSGYHKKKGDYQEGDVWEENNKTWTIKNGIKQTISKLDAVREFMAMPLCCPNCGNAMKKKLDKKFWALKRQCFDCTIEEDTNRILTGTFTDYEKDHISKNVTHWVTDMEAAISDYIEHANINRNVTEDGQIEDWSGEHNQSELEGILSQQLDEFKEKAKEYIKSNDNNIG